MFTGTVTIIPIEHGLYGADIKIAGFKANNEDSSDVEVIELDKLKLKKHPKIFNWYLQRTKGETDIVKVKILGSVDKENWTEIGIIEEVNEGTSEPDGFVAATETTPIFWKYIKVKCKIVGEGNELDLYLRVLIY